MESGNKKEEGLMAIPIGRSRRGVMLIMLILLIMLIILRLEVVSK